MEKDKVSLITPCYNGEAFISRYLEAILNQSYDNIELILINDGSTDKTEEIIKSYEKKLQEKGIDLIYIYQKNSGQAEAINKGLDIFSGIYVSWPDSDDILEKDYVKNKVMYLEHNLDVDIVITNVAYVSEYNVEKVDWILKRNKPEGEDTFFRDLIMEENVSYQPGAYMVRSSALTKYVGRKIYPSRAGQNWQLLLPIAYSGKVGYLNQTLYRYVCRKDSHSKEIYGNYRKQKTRAEQHEDLLYHVIMTIPFKTEEEQRKWLYLIAEKYARRKIKLAFRYGNKADIKISYEKLKEQNCVTKEDMEYYEASLNLLKWHYLKTKEIFAKVKNKIIG